MRTLLALLGLVVLHALFAVALYAEPPDAPPRPPLSRLREVSPATLGTPLSRHVRLQGLELGWGRDTSGARVMCATSERGVTCHRRGLVHQRVAAAEITLGLAMAIGGSVPLTQLSVICFDDEPCNSDQEKLAASLGFISIVGGGALMATGIVALVQQASGVRWLRRRHATLTPTANLTGGSSNVGASLSLTF